MIFQRKPRIPELSVSELIQLNDKLDTMIQEWVDREINKGIKTNSKLAELAVSNLKIIYSENEFGTQLRKFIIQDTTATGEKEYLYSRIHDLYIMIKISFPSYFIDSLVKRHIEAIDELQYPVNKKITQRYFFAWLFHKIQFSIRYRSKVNSPQF